MRISFDPGKDVANTVKHGISLAMAAEIDWSDVMARPDTRSDYRELREIGFGFIGDRPYCVVFTQRGETFHVISLRKANTREVQDYAASY
ncbi:BrnT family toxin [Cupriavidus sp. WGtm5]|uniref:BrnT family toxin n=1 Tax=Cupriavidus sp. WGtm5 TaxID=2919926 RepID=UPI000E1FE079|nr:BrnT family toxin [Cupriavidus taiwanensis]MCO4891630.1 BrnT family toxin [Cupriavidus sp. WGtm5]